MSYLERLIDLRKTTVGKVVSVLMSIMLVLTMTNLMSTIAFAAANDGDVIEGTDVDGDEPNGQQDGNGEDQPAMPGDAGEKSGDVDEENDASKKDVDQTPTKKAPVNKKAAVSLFDTIEEDSEAAVNSGEFLIAPAAITVAEEGDEPTKQPPSITTDNGDIKDVKACPNCGSADLAKITESDATCSTPGFQENGNGNNFALHCMNCNTFIFSNHASFDGFTDHSWKTVDHIDATCTDTGVEGGEYCTVCGEGRAAAEKVIPALGHDYDKGVVTTDPTCIEDGVKTYTCQNNTSHTKTETIKATGEHKLGDWVDQATGAYKAATCDEDGYKTQVRTCTVCFEAAKTQKVTLPATGHVWDAGTVTKPATCTEKGVKTYTCKNDATHTKTETIKAAGHELVNDVEKPATCTEDGIKAGAYCKNCDYTDGYGVIPALGHDYDNGVVTKPATCTEKGVKTYTCKNDATHTKTETIEATGHNKEGVVDHKDATCTENGVEGGTYCTACDEGKRAAEAVIPAPGHTEKTIPAIEASCMTHGYTEGIKCSVCDEVLVNPRDLGININNHENVDESYAEEVAATCTTPGHKYYAHCDACGRDLAPAERTPALGHDWGEWTEAEAATCLGKGAEQRTCDRCGFKETKEIDALGHDMVTDEAVAATCTATGLTAGSHCSRCDEATTEQEITPVLGHDLSTETIEATCEDDGVATTSCSRCDYEVTKTIDATGHAYGEWTVVTPATATANGSEQRVCANDASHIETRVIAATGDDTNDNPVTIPDNANPTTNPSTTTGTAGGTTIGAGAAAGVAAPAAPAAPADGAAAAPVAIPDDATPLANPDDATDQIDDDANPLANFDQIVPECWVHWLLLAGLIVSICYGAGVVIARKNEINAIDNVEQRAMGNTNTRKFVASALRQHS